MKKYSINYQIHRKTSQYIRDGRDWDRYDKGVVRAESGNDESQKRCLWMQRTALRRRRSRLAASGRRDESFS